MSVMYRSLLALFYVLIFMTTRAAGAQLPPTIQVDARYEIVFDKNETGIEYGRTFFKWTAQNTDYVLVIDRFVRRVQPQGEFEGGTWGGSYLFIAVGSGGSTAQYIDASLTPKPGTGRHGVIYDFDKEFDLRKFFENTYKHSFITSKKLEEVREAALKVLQEMVYTVDITRQATTNVGALLYTKDFNFNKSLGPSLKEIKDRGEFQRQVAFVIMILPPPSDHEKWQLYVMPLVRLNYPKDTDKWEPDPDGLQVGRPASVALANAIVAALKEEDS